MNSGSKITSVRCIYSLHWLSTSSCPSYRLTFVMRKSNVLFFSIPRYQITKYGGLTVLNMSVNVFQISAESVNEISYHSWSRYRGFNFNCCYAVRWILTWIWSCQRIVLKQRSDIVSIYGTLIRSVILIWDFFSLEFNSFSIGPIKPVCCELTLLNDSFFFCLFSWRDHSPKT